MTSAMPWSMDLGDAARTLGVHYQTAYRWIRTGALQAVKIDGEYRLTAEDVQSFAASRRAGQAVGYTGRSRDWAGLVEQFYRAAVTGNETGARRVFERLHLARVPMLEQCEELVAPVARRLDAEFRDGAVLAAQVRLAAAISERLLRWAASRLPVPAAHRALVVTPAGERHHLPVAMASSILRAERWAVAEIAGGAEPADLLAFAARMEPGFVVISTTVTEAAAKDLAAALSGTLRSPILVGGAGAPLRELVDAASIARETQSIRLRLPVRAGLSSAAGQPAA